MALNWTTFALEIINFLALLWILKRFLYRPIMQTLAARQAGIERTLAAARTAQVNAAAMQQQFERRLADWEQEKAVLRMGFESELATERVRQMTALAKDLTIERERRAAQDAHLLETQRRQLATQASKEARRFASTLLGRLAGPELERQWVQFFIEELAAFPEDRLSALRAGQSGHGQGGVTSAFELSEVQRKDLAAAITARLGKAITFDFMVDPSLLTGVRLTLGDWQLDFSLAGELGVFGEATNLGQ
jgi:F-type H+-transporting ATPase subunit b